MVMKFDIGIVGLGYVGGAVLHAYKLKGYDVHTFDVDLSKNPTCVHFEELITRANLIYVAVPTPMKSTGECDTSIVEQVVDDICTSTEHVTIIIKSTVPPETTDKLQARHPNHYILFNPEFLTEANYLNDYLNQEVVLLGKPDTVPQHVAEWILEHQVGTMHSIKFAQIVPARVAELYKYTANLFLATKVAFANELYDIASSINIDWNQFTNLLREDSRLGKSHWKVPGPDGHRGFGGTCFPKDLSGLINYAKTKDIQTPLLKSVWTRNILVDRPERDWEHMKGRAISHE
jgi:UDPglucose 6-dehydrogenase